jgi:hypothetical protein
MFFDLLKFYIVFSIYFKVLLLLGDNLELTQLVRTQRCTPERAWNIASSEHWYNDDDFWLDLITNDSTYRAAMIAPELELIDLLCNDLRGAQQAGIFVALGPGDSKKESALHAALGTSVYAPVDVNTQQLTLAAASVPGHVRPLHMEFREGLRTIKDEHPKFLYLGATYSNLDAMDHDLLAAMDETMGPGDSMYLSVQTFPCAADLPLLTHQYHNAQQLRLNTRMAGIIGADVTSPFVQYNPRTKNLEVGSIISAVRGTARDVGMRPGDQLITMVSHKPESLGSELAVRFGARYTMNVYQVQHRVPTPSGTYTSTFEGAVLRKR